MSPDAPGEELFATLYAQLRRLADRELQRHPGASVSPTTLVHETYLSVAGREGLSFPTGRAFWDISPAPCAVCSSTSPVNKKR